MRILGSTGYYQVPIRWLERNPCESVCLQHCASCFWLCHLLPARMALMDALRGGHVAQAIHSEAIAGCLNEPSVRIFVPPVPIMTLVSLPVCHVLSAIASSCRT